MLHTASQSWVLTDMQQNHLGLNWSVGKEHINNFHIIFSIFFLKLASAVLQQVLEAAESPI